MSRFICYLCQSIGRGLSEVVHHRYYINGCRGVFQGIPQSDAYRATRLLIVIMASLSKKSLLAFLQSVLDSFKSCIDKMDR